MVPCHDTRILNTKKITIDLPNVFLNPSEFTGESNVSSMIECNRSTVLFYNTSRGIGQTITPQHSVIIRSYSIKETSITDGQQSRGANAFDRE